MTQQVETTTPAPKKTVRMRPLGATGIEVSELSLGTWGLSGDGYGPVAPSEAEATVTRAIELGITLVDTSDAYGKGATEELVGRVLERVGKEVRVATRHGIDRSGVVARRRYDPAYLEAALEKSLERLRRPFVDVYMLHNPSMDVPMRREVIEFMKGLKEKGKAKAIGFSVGDRVVGRAAVEAGVDVIEIAYNAMHGADLHALAGEVAERKVGVLAHSVLAYGLLAARWHQAQTFTPGDHRADRWQGDELLARLRQIAPLHALVMGEVLTVRAAALRFVLSNNLVSSAVLGPKNVTQLEQLVREAGSGPPYLDEQQLALLPRRMAAMGVYL